VSATTIGLLAGLSAALCFGLGDFLAQSLARERGWLSASLAVQLVSVVLLALLGLAWPGPPTRLVQLELALALGSANALGIIGLYRAFELGKLSLVSPIAGSMGAFTLVFAWLAGAAPPLLVVPGLALVLVGILAASVPDEHETSAARGARGVGWALLSSLAFGWVFLRLGELGSELGSTWSVLALRVVAIPWLVLVALAARKPLAQPSRGRGRAALLAVAVLDSSGLLALSIGGEHGDASVASVLSSAFPVVTIALARRRLHEQLAWWQWLGVAAIVLGVAWVAIWRQ
jgi:drug/metabolite transporter (DMT)-like permease